MSIRLDEMSFKEVKTHYEKIFNNLLTENEFNTISLSYEKKYNEAYSAHYEKHYKVSGGMGRGFKYVLAMLYGWYIEELLFALISKNQNIKNVEYSGNDSEHKFIYDNEKKLIKIAGKKTTNPDFLLTLKNNVKLFIELKTAAAGIYTIKKGNVMQLYKTMGKTGIYSIVLMVDIINANYDLKDINYFTNLHPFVNQRMEGQLCYQLPTPKKEFKNLINENFIEIFNDEIFNNVNVKKYKLLYIATNKKHVIKNLIKNKISYENKIEDFEYQKLTHEKELEKVAQKFPDITKLSWEDIDNILK